MSSGLFDIVYLSMQQLWLVLVRHGRVPLTYINYWTEHSSNDSSADVQGAAVTYYVPSWAAPCPIFICSKNFRDDITAESLDNLNSNCEIVWTNIHFARNINQYSLHPTTDPLA